MSTMLETQCSHSIWNPVVGASVPQTGDVCTHDQGLGEPHDGLKINLVNSHSSHPVGVRSVMMVCVPQWSQKTKLHKTAAEGIFKSKEEI